MEEEKQQSFLPACSHGVDVPGLALFTVLALHRRPWLLMPFDLVEVGSADTSMSKHGGGGESDVVGHVVPPARPSQGQIK